MTTNTTSVGGRPDVELGQWRPMFRLGAIGAAFVLIMMPIQAAIFLISPPPTTVPEYFELFQRNPFLGLLDLDLLLTLDYLMMVPLYLALFVLTRRHSATLATLALVAGLFSLLLFFVTREATFSMWMLSDQYAAASTDAERDALTASGQMLLTLYNGGTFSLSYILGAVSTLLFAFALLISLRLGRGVALAGLVTGTTMLVPANAGQFGLVVSLLSLIPTAVWLVLLVRGFVRVGALRDGAAWPPSSPRSRRDRR